jgi:hypothetical protein
MATYGAIPRHGERIERKGQRMKRTKMNVTSWLCAMSSVMLLLGACSAAPDTESEALGLADSALTTGASTSFICGKSIDGTIGCVCDWSGDIVMSCAGMMELCDLIGPGMTCDMDNVCSCIVGPTEPQPEDRGAQDQGALADPLGAIESFGIEPQGGLPKGFFVPGAGVAYKDDKSAQIVACVSDCRQSHTSESWCTWQCNCTINEGKDRMTCESQNPYIDLHETPPPKPPKEPQPGNDIVE